MKFTFIGNKKDEVIEVKYPANSKKEKGETTAAFLKHVGVYRTLVAA